MIATAQIERILDRYSEIEARMASDPGAAFAKLAKEYSDLGPIVAEAREVQRCASVSGRRLSSPLINPPTPNCVRWQARSWPK